MMRPAKVAGFRPPRSISTRPRWPTGSGWRSRICPPCSRIWGILRVRRLGSWDRAEAIETAICYRRRTSAAKPPQIVIDNGPAKDGPLQKKPQDEKHKRLTSLRLQLYGEAILRHGFHGILCRRQELQVLGEGREMGEPGLGLRVSLGGLAAAVGVNWPDPLVAQVLHPPEI